MTSHPPESPTEITNWIVEARAGSKEALAKLMKFSRQYLLLIANDEMSGDLQAKAGASDLVQETQMEAAEGFGQFCGHSAAELLVWLRQILLHNLRDLERHYGGTAKRQTSREISLADAPSSHNLADAFVGNTPSPSSHLQHKEQAEQLARAVDQLPDDYRQVILWHHRDNCSFAEIGERLKRSTGAARKLWARAVRELQERLKVLHESRT